MAALFVAMVVLTLGFGVHAGYMLVTRWINQGQPIVEGWMTPRLVVLSFGLPPDALAPVLGVAEDRLPFTTLDDLAAERGVEAQALIAAVGRVIAAAGKSQ